MDRVRATNLVGSAEIMMAQRRRMRHGGYYCFGSVYLHGRRLVGSLWSSQPFLMLHMMLQAVGGFVLGSRRVSRGDPRSPTLQIGPDISFVSPYLSFCRSHHAPDQTKHLSTLPLSPSSLRPSLALNITASRANEREWVGGQAGRQAGRQAAGERTSQHHNWQHLTLEIPRVPQCGVGKWCEVCLSSELNNASIQCHGKDRLSHFGPWHSGFVRLRGPPWPAEGHRP